MFQTARHFLAPKQCVRHPPVSRLQRCMGPGARYGLVLVGLTPASDRDAIGTVRDFAAFAKARLAAPGHCLAATYNGETMCKEKLAFVAIHYDSFADELCPDAAAPDACGPETEAFLAAAGSSGLFPVRDVLAVLHAPANSSLLPSWTAGESLHCCT